MLANKLAEDSERLHCTHLKLSAGPQSHNHVRWGWQTAGILDDLISGQYDRARARAGLLLKATSSSPSYTLTT